MGNRGRRTHALAQALVRHGSANGIGVWVAPEQDQVRFVGRSRQDSLELLTFFGLTHGVILLLVSVGTRQRQPPAHRPNAAGAAFVSSQGSPERSGRGGTCSKTGSCIAVCATPALRLLCGGYSLAWRFSRVAPGEARHPLPSRAQSLIPPP